MKYCTTDWWKSNIYRWQAFLLMKRIIVSQNKRGGDCVKRDKKEMTWSLAMRGNPIVSDPAPIVTDPNGSYTGRPKDPYEIPIQDADDL
jgi:hypothetical protein